MAENRGAEIITLQFGDYANFIGAHWWNSQESGFEYSPDAVSDINHDVLFREGLNHKKEVTFTPRLLLVDLKSSLGFQPVNDLYENESESDVLGSLSTWPSSKVETIRENQDAEYSNEFQKDLKLEKKDEEIDLKKYNLEDSVQYWTDFMRTRYHPKSFNLIQEYQHGNVTQPFDCYLQGIDIWKSEAMSEDFVDEIRSYVEECDCLQGFQIVSDATDGFGGVCANALQYIKDEYTSKACLVFPVTPPRTAECNVRLRTVNTTLLISSLAECADMFSPLSLSADCWNQTETYRQLPHLQYNPSLPYQSSAILSALLDSVSLPYRLRATGIRLNDLCSLLTPVGRKCTTSSLSLPWPLKHGQSLLECLEQWEGPLTTSLTPYTSVDPGGAGEGVDLQVMTLRGVEERRIFPSDIHNRDRSSNPAYACSSVQELLRFFLSCDMPSTLHRVFSSMQPIKTVNPFPNVFGERVSPHGCVNEDWDKTERVSQVPSMAGLHCCQSTGTMLLALHSSVRKVNTRSLPVLASLDRTDYEECLEAVISLSDNYKPDHDL